MLTPPPSELFWPLSGQGGRVSRSLDLFSAFLCVIQGIQFADGARSRTVEDAKSG